MDGIQICQGRTGQVRSYQHSVNIYIDLNNTILSSLLTILHKAS